MTDAVKLRSLKILAEPHKGTRGGPADAPRHRFADGPGLAAIPLNSTADLPAVVNRGYRNSATQNHSA
jgi:hypothetical protein